MFIPGSYYKLTRLTDVYTDARYSPVSGKIFVRFSWATIRIATRFKHGHLCLFTRGYKQGISLRICRFINFNRINGGIYILFVGVFVMKKINIYECKECSDICQITFFTDERKPVDIGCGCIFYPGKKNPMWVKVV